MSASQNTEVLILKDSTVISAQPLSLIKVLPGITKKSLLSGGISKMALIRTVLSREMLTMQKINSTIFMGNLTCTHI